MFKSSLNHKIDSLLDGRTHFPNEIHMHFAQVMLTTNGIDSLHEEYLSAQNIQPLQSFITKNEKEKHKSKQTPHFVLWKVNILWYSLQMFNVL